MLPQILSEPGSSAEPKSKNAALRMPELDSVRALGALSVMFCHHLMIYPVFLHDTHTQHLGWINILKYTPLHFFFNGFALMLFFIMSGFVLMLPFVYGRGDTYAAFAIKRFFRIYPPYFVAVATAIACCALLQPLQYFPELSPIINATWRHALWPECIVRHALMIFPSFNTRAFDPVIWSLVHEMRISLIFPVIVWFVLRTNWRFPLAAILALAASSFAVEPWIARFGHNDYGETYRYVPLFIAGALAAKHTLNIKEAYAKVPLPARIAFVCLTLSVFCYPYTYIKNYLPHGAILDYYAASIGSVMILVLALGSPWFISFLRHPVLIWLGMISYSMYLFHGIVLLLAINLLHNHLPMPLICLISMSSTLVVSYIGYKVIEAPTMEFGRQLAKRVNRKLRGGKAAESTKSAAKNSDERVLVGTRD